MTLPSHSKVYDTIGTQYRRRRTPDARIAARIVEALGDAQRVCNVGAGTGSYEPDDREVVAVEPSQTMIDQRTSTHPVERAAAEALPFADNSFDAAMAIMSVHHWEDPAAGLAEMRRIAPRQVISFDFSSQATCPSVSPLSLAQAVTRCSIALPDFFANDRRSALPSMAINFPPVAACNACVHVKRHLANLPRSSIPKTRRNVSCEGIPLGSWEVGKLQKRTQPLLPRLAELLDVRPVFRSTHHGQQRDAENVDQPMVAPPDHPRVRQLRKTLPQTVHIQPTQIVHDRPSPPPDPIAAIPNRGPRSVSCRKLSY